MTRYDPEKDRRRSIRLKGYDYAQPGAYFVTICTFERLCLFGEIVDGTVILNGGGEIATKCWNDIPVHFPHVALDQFVVMPNHVHGILWIVKTVGAKNISPLRSQPAGTSKTIGSIIRGFKIGVTQWMRQERNVRDVWQRNYYEHVIRDETALNRIRQYIVENPVRWAEDLENPKCARPIRRRERRGETLFAAETGADEPGGGEVFSAPVTGADERGRGERFFAPTMGTARKSAPTGNDPPSQRRPP